ncbi:MAG TPA: NUDIX hydrolase [Pyrinomonadaceae bacterium]|nr:NUDIX hydrolase [Pyrinomonadaceae bacterium]
MRITHARFTVTAGAVIQNDQGQVLLLKHTFRAGSGWGLPGGFLQGGEQPIDGLRRELREEIGLELERIEFFAARSFRKPQQVEILFRGFASGSAQLKSIEIDRAVWFSPNSLPDGLPKDQRLIVEQALSDGAKAQT